MIKNYELLNEKIKIILKEKEKLAEENRRINSLLNEAINKDKNKNNILKEKYNEILKLKQNNSEYRINLENNLLKNKYEKKTTIIRILLKYMKKI